MKYLLLLAVVLAGCGGKTPTSPSPSPTPSPAPPPARTSIAGHITDTMSGAPVGSFTSDASSFPARVTVSLAGYLTRETWIRSSTPSVDLIRNAAPFDLGFYRQLVRNGFEAPTALDQIRVLAQAPSFYMEVEGAKGLSQQIGLQFEQIARRLVPVLTGGRFQVAHWETGPTPRPEQAGWIMIERLDTTGVCGSARIGASAGHIWIDAQPQGCAPGAVFAHELGHALGFFHVGIMGSLMYPQQRSSNLADAPTDAERYHAAIAYHRSAGNLDVDADPLSSSPARTLRVVD